MYNDGQNWNHKSRSRKSENFSKSWQLNYQNVPCDLTKKMNTHTLCFCPLIRKLQAFEILKWTQGSQWRKQRTSNFTREIQHIFTAVKIQLLIFSRLWNRAFLKYALYLINIFLYFITLYIIKTNIFSVKLLILSYPYMFWLLKRTVSLRRFFWVPTTCFGWERRKLFFCNTLITKGLLFIIYSC